MCTGKRTVWKALLPPWFSYETRPCAARCSLTQSSPRPDPDCCHSASYAQLLSVLEPISFLERTFRTFCHLFALLCIPAILKSNFMKQSYTRSINDDKQLIISRVFESLWTLIPGHWVTLLWHRVTRTWADKVVDTGSWHRGATQCQHLGRYQDSDWVSYWHIVKWIVWTASVELSKSDLKAPAPSGGGELAANAGRQQRGGAAGSRDWAHFRGARRY